MRQYARGRAYDPARYGGVTPYHDGEATIQVADKVAEAVEAPAPETVETPEAAAVETEVQAVEVPAETADTNTED